MGNAADASGTDGRNEVNRCRIQFRGWRSLIVTDLNAAGTLDENRTPTYRAFVRALHERLAKAPPGTITFTAGATESRHTVMKVIAVIAALFFVGTPLVLLFLVRDWRIFGVLFAGTMFVWPFWNIVQNNRPRTYDPRYPPPELME